ncbi:cysteine--tRNA ligase [bacterium]|nr:cysteine--tRNA ligase [bacterium]|tara:strand:- start:20809 stop:22245 length:1437 start_codon:yes stop_codon:yes gene_type:complete
MDKNPLYLTNTLSRKKEAFVPLRIGEVKMYNCGPTVYDHQHIGNLSAAVFADILRRTLEYNGYSVKQVMNFTDFGHLTSDADEGEDKMAVGLKREGLEPTLENMRSLADTYIASFLEDIKALNVNSTDTQFPRASDYIEPQVVLIQTLVEKDYAYELEDGVYFDTQQFPTYGELGGQSESEQETGARVEANPDKRDPRDFVLWKKNPDLGWDSPWGKGFPGWHIECSGMIFALLGRQIDIHTGGIEHIGVHHNNEIAQSEAATGKKPFSRFWLHRAHIQVEGRKISKSLGNTVYLRQISDRGFSPLSYRYWLLTSHYSTPANFTWDALEGAHAALKKLHRYFVDELNVDDGLVDTQYQEKFTALINDDLNTPKAVALVWELVKDEDVTPEDKRATLLLFDSVLGLGLNESKDRLAELLKGGGQKLSISDAPENIQKLVEEREKAREQKDFERSDELRQKIKKEGYTIEDTDKGPQLSK